MFSKFLKKSPLNPLQSAKKFCIFAKYTTNFKKITTSRKFYHLKSSDL